jgi:hypothetical protein
MVWKVNGEIYNHEELRKRLKNHKFRTGSDCEVIAHLVSVVSFLILLLMWLSSFDLSLMCFMDIVRGVWCGFC